jgi:hypothetical protein
VEQCLAALQSMLQMTGKEVEPVAGCFRKYTAEARTKEQVDFFDKILYDVSIKTLAP